MMRVLIDLRWMLPGYTGGIESLSRSFLRSLISLDGINEYHIFLPYESCYDFDFRGRENFHLHASNGPGYFVDRWLRYRESQTMNGRAFTLRSSSVVEKIRSHVDLALCLNGIIAPDLLDLPAVILAIDAQHEYFPELFDSEELSRRREDIRRSLSKAKMICAISAFTRMTFVNKLGVEPDSIKVVYPAADERFSMPYEASAAQHSLSGYGLQAGEYFYYPAATWPHKNHALLLRSMAQLKMKGVSTKLVCTGAAKEAHSQLLNLVDELCLKDQVVFCGYLPQEDLATFYRGATALVYPSLFEGFGMPILEAMASGCPVACSNSTSMPEVAGEAALFFDPTSLEELTNVLHRLSTDPSLRQDLISRGFEQVKLFSWLDFTRQLVESLAGVACNQGAQAACLPAQPNNFRVEIDKMWNQSLKRPLSKEMWRAGWAKFLYYINQHSRARSLLFQAESAVVQGKYYKAGWLRFLALLLAPEVYFAVSIFPRFRQRWLSGKLRPV